MPNISEFILNLSSPTYADLQDQTGDLVIIETGLTTDRNGSIDTSGLTLSTNEVADLQASGQTVVGYLNVSVTDHNRGYWNPDWVDFNGLDGGGPDNQDVGDVNPGAPDWLQDPNNHGYATSGDETFGYIVDYANADWQQRVIAEAIHMVTPVAEGGLGYSGLFLDDVGRYFDAWQNEQGAYPIGQAAAEMIAFVNLISDAVHTVAPDVFISINNGLDIGENSMPPNGADFDALLANVDAILMENQYAEGSWDRGVRYWGNDAILLAVEHSGTLDDPDAFVAWALERGIVPHVALNGDYNQPAVTPGAGTAGDDLLNGGDGPNILDGLGSNDTLIGLGGNDTLFGAGGNDSLLGGTHEDLLFGGNGQDTLSGGAGFDRLEGGADNDLLDGGAQADNVFGGTGNDTLLGGDGFDRLFGEDGDDFGYGGQGTDGIFGQLGNDRLFGQGENDRLFGGQGNDFVDGGAHADFLHGGAGFDTLIGSTGNDTMTGAFNADTFVFADFGGGFGNDVIQDFDANNTFERIDLSRVSGISDLDDLANNHIVQIGSDVVIDDGNGNTITLQNVLLADLLDGNDFIF